MDSGHQKRKSYTVKRMLDILREYEPGARGKGFLALSKKHNISRSTLEGWYRKRSELEENLKNRTTKSRNRRQVEGGGRHAYFPSVENTLARWVKERNNKGLRVKDKFI